MTMSWVAQSTPSQASMILHVVLDRAGLGLDDAVDDGEDVGRVLGRLEVGLLGGELHRTGRRPVELLDALGERAGVPELLVDVGGERLGDLLGADAVEMRRRWPGSSSPSPSPSSMRAVRSSTIASRLAAFSSARMPAPTFCLVAIS